MTTESLMIDARNELNLRQRGRESRLARLQEAGLPAEHTALRRWLRNAEDAANPDAVYHACTARLANGVDADLPRMAHWGCRVSRVPIKASYYPAGFEFGDSEEPLEEPVVIVSYASVGTGYMATGMFPLSCLTDDGESLSTEELCHRAEQRVRANLLTSSSCFPTRAEAERAAIDELRSRAAAAEVR